MIQDIFVEMKTSQSSSHNKIPYYIVGTDLCHCLEGAASYIVPTVSKLTSP